MPDADLPLRRLILHEAGPFQHLDMAFPEGGRPDRADVHLLVGPNGAGKSTVLSGIAQCFSWSERVGFGKRMWGEASYALIDFDAKLAGVSLFSLDKDYLIFEDLKISRILNREKSNYLFYGITNHVNYIEISKESLTFLKYKSLPVFAYSGLRAANDASVHGLREQSDNPLIEACSFHRPEGTAPLIQWIANTRTKQVLYAAEGRAQEAEDRRLALERLTGALSEVVGEPVRITLEIDPFAVRMAIGGRAAVPVDQLPDGMQSMFSWLGDLLMRMDRIPWAEPGPVTDRRFLLLLDEVEVHLHPAWQRRVLPMAERLFPNAQIVASTHSPFVIGSASDAWIHPFRLEGAQAVADPPVRGPLGSSYPVILSGIMGVTEEFDIDTEGLLSRFRALWRARLGGDEAADAELQEVAQTLSARSQELHDIVTTGLRDLRRRLERGRPA